MTLGGIFGGLSAAPKTLVVLVEMSSAGVKKAVCPSR